MVNGIVIPNVLNRFLDTNFWFSETIPNPHKAIALIGREQLLMDIYVDGGMPAVANLLGIPADILTNRWRKFKKKRLWGNLKLEDPAPFFHLDKDYDKLLSDKYCTHTDPLFGAIYCHPPMVLGRPIKDTRWVCDSAKARQELNKVLEKEVNKVADLSYEDRAWLLFTPRLDLGLVPLMHYAERGKDYLEAAKLILKHILAYKQPPPEELIEDRPEYMARYNLDMVLDGKDKDYDRLRLFRRYRKSQCFKLAYPRYPSRKFHVLWNEPKTHEGEAYYPIEALWGAGLEINVKPGRTYHYEGAPGARGGYVTAEYVAKNDFYRWIPEGEYAAVKKPATER